MCHFRYHGPLRPCTWGRHAKADHDVNLRSNLRLFFRIISILHNGLFCTLLSISSSLRLLFSAGIFASPQENANGELLEVRSGASRWSIRLFRRRRRRRRSGGRGRGWFVSSSCHRTEVRSALKTGLRHFLPSLETRVALGMRIICNGCFVDFQRPWISVHFARDSRRLPLPRYRFEDAEP